MIYSQVIMRLLSPVAGAGRNPGKTFTASAILLFILIWIGAALPLSGIPALELDDKARLSAFLDYLSSAASAPREELDMDGRVVIHVVDGAGHSLPFASYRVSAGRIEVCRGRAFSDGTFFFYPRRVHEVPTGELYRLEVSARGAASVIMLDPELPSRLSVAIPGARPLPEPLPCDIVFVIDTARSMSKYLEPLKRMITAVGQAAAAANPPLQLRSGLVLYRDCGDEYLVKSAPLSTDLKAFGAALANADAGERGDTAEDLGAGLRAAVEGMNYAQNGIRLVFAFTDAPPSIRAGDLSKGGAGYSDVCEAALESGIKIYTAGMGQPVMSGEYALRQIAAYTGAVYLEADPPADIAMGGAIGAIHGDLGTLIERIIAGEAASARSGKEAIRDPGLALLDSVQSRMASALVYPEAARLRGASGTVRVSLTVDERGNLLSASVSSSSGSSILDRAALDLARSVFPLANPAGSRLEMEIAVAYRLQ
jgi:TonB family protein